MRQARLGRRALDGDEMSDEVELKFDVEPAGVA
jgi:hypothetical protein